MNTNQQKPANAGDQDNIGYENTEVRNNQDDQENNRLQTTETGNSEGPEEKPNDSAGLRSESGKKSMASESGNVERGK